jgi:hypothetical protein
MAAAHANEKGLEEVELPGLGSGSGSRLLNSKPEDVDESPLPTPVTANASKAGAKIKLSASAIIPIWIVLSSSVIIYNNYVLNDLKFRFPVFLVTWHLTFAVRPHRSKTDL